MIKKIILTILVVCVFALNSSLGAEVNALGDFTRQRLAVFPIHNNPALTERLVGEFKRFLEIEVVPTSEVEYAIKKNGVRPYELFNVEKAAKIGEDLNADLTLFTDLEINPLTINVFTGLVGVEKANLLKTEALSGRANESESLITRLVFRIMAKRYYSTPLKGYPKLISSSSPGKGFGSSPASKAPTRDAWAYSKIPFDELTFIDAKQYPLDFDNFFWLEDNESLLGVLNSGGKQMIVIININGGNYKVLYKSNLSQKIASLSLSPNKKELAFATSDSIYLLSLSGQNEAKELTKGITPSWSPDSSKLAYIASKKEADIWVYDIKNRRKRKVMSGKDPCWLENGREIIAQYSLNKSSVTIINEMQTTRTVKGRQAIPLLNLLGQSSFGGEKVAFSPNKRLFLSMESGELTIRDLWKKRKTSFLVLGNSIRVEEGSISWSGDGTMVAFRENSDGKMLLTIGTIGEKPKTYLKINLGFKDGINEQDKLALIRLESENSPITDQVSKFSEKTMGMVKIFKAYPNCSTMIFPSGEVNVELTDKIKARDSKDQVLEGTIIYLEPGIEKYTVTTDKQAEHLFNQALMLVEESRWNEALPYLDVILKYYPDHTSINKVEDLYEALQNH